MPAFASNNGTLPTLAQYNANQIAHLSGYDDDGGATTRVEYLTTAGPPARLEVKISRKHPTFFAGIFGMQPRMISASAQGEVKRPAAVARRSRRSRTPLAWLPVWGAGFFTQGNATLTVNGNIESNSQVFLQPTTGESSPARSRRTARPARRRVQPEQRHGRRRTDRKSRWATYHDSISASVASLEPFCIASGTSMYTAVGTALIANPATWTNTGGPGLRHT